MPSRDSSAVLVVTGAELSARAEALSGSTIEIPTGIDFSVQPLLLRPIETGITFAITPGIQVKIEVGMQMTITAAEADFGYSRDLVAAAQSDLSESVTDFVLIGQSFTDLTFRTVANGGRVASEDGDDIKLTASNVVQLAHNLITYDDSTGAIFYDLKFPTWTFTNDVRHRLFYGNAGIAAPLSDPAGCYSRTAAVWTWPLGLDVSGNGRSLTVIDIDDPTPDPEYALPADPVTVKAGYTGTTYYVGPSGTGHSKTTEGDPGAFEATLENANDLSRIIVLPGSYAGFNAAPKSGQTGRLMIQAQNVAITAIDVTSLGGLATLNPSAHSVVTGTINLVGFKNVWVEGFRMGPTSGSASGGSGKIRIYGADAPTARNWYLRNWHYNIETTQFLVGDRMQFVHYQNFHLCNFRPDGDWGSDYHIRIQNSTGNPFGDVKEVYSVENIFRGGANQVASLKDSCETAYFFGNVFDQSIIVDGTTGGTVMLLGQVTDSNALGDVTSGTVEIAYNKFRKGNGQLIINPSNVQDVLIHHNSFAHTGVGSACSVLEADVRDVPGETGETMLGPRHPRNWTFRDNTISGSASNWVWRLGWVYVNGCSVTIENNTVPSGGIDGVLDAFDAQGNRTFPDGGLEGGGPDFVAEKRPTVVYGTNPGLNAPS